MPKVFVSLMIEFFIHETNFFTLSCRKVRWLLPKLFIYSLSFNFYTKQFIFKFIERVFHCFLHNFCDSRTKCTFLIYFFFTFTICSLYLHLHSTIVNVHVLRTRIPRKWFRVHSKIIKNPQSPNALGKNPKISLEFRQENFLGISATRREKQTKSFHFRCSERIFSSFIPTPSSLVAFECCFGKKKWNYRLTLQMQEKCKGKLNW